MTEQDKLEKSQKELRAKFKNFKPSLFVYAGFYYDNCLVVKIDASEIDPATNCFKNFTEKELIGLVNSGIKELEKVIGRSRSYKKYKVLNPQEPPAVIVSSFHTVLGLDTDIFPMCGFDCVVEPVFMVDIYIPVQLRAMKRKGF